MHDHYPPCMNGQRFCSSTFPILSALRWSEWCLQQSGSVREGKTHHLKRESLHTIAAVCLSVALDRLVILSAELTSEWVEQGMASSKKHLFFSILLLLPRRLIRRKQKCLFYLSMRLVCQENFIVNSVIALKNPYSVFITASNSDFLMAFLWKSNMTLELPTTLDVL